MKQEVDESKALKGWRTWGGDRCDHCCNGDRCDDRTHLDRQRCPYCLGTGQALWLKYKGFENE
jgi:hypothetical protein